MYTVEIKNFKLKYFTLIHFLIKIYINLFYSKFSYTFHNLQNSSKNA